MAVSKRIVSLFLCLILIATSITVVAGASEEVTEETPPERVTLENGIKLKLTEVYEETAYAVCQSDLPSGDVVIPESYVDVPVRQVFEGAFYYDDDITSVTMPDTIWVIEDGAFNSCPNLKWIDISKNIRTIDDSAFLAMHGLEEYLIGGSETGESVPYAYTEALTQKNGIQNYYVSDGVLFLNDSLYLIGNKFRYFDYVRLFSYPQGKKDIIYKIPNNVIGIENTAFFSPVYLKTLVIPSSLRSFYAHGLYYYDYNSDDLLGGPINVVFQHDDIPETLKASYYNEFGVEKINYIPLYMESTVIRDAWDGSQIIFKDEVAKNAFETYQNETKNFVRDTVDGDGGSELPAFVVAPKATTNLTLDTKVDRIKLGDTVTIFATQKPLDTTDDLEFSTADETIASFDGFSRGYLSGNKVGTTTYYVKSGDKIVKHDVTVTCDHIDRNGNSTLEVQDQEANHPHLISYKCSACGEVKTEKDFYLNCLECTGLTENPIQETENTVIDYENRFIYTTVKNNQDITKILKVSETANIITTPSFVYGDFKHYGTGTTITVPYGSDYTVDFSLIVEGDLNGDSVCDVLDAAVAQLYSAGFYEPTENEIYAANGCISDEIDATSYQNVINTCLAS